MTSGPHRYRFAGLEFDPVTGELHESTGSRRRLPPKAARLLLMLLERPGEMVSRDELRREIWPQEHVELDQVLAYTVRQVREALGDDAAQPRLVETLPRRGYRFIAQLEPEVTANEPSPSPPRRRARWRVALAAALAVATMALLWGWWSSRSKPASPAPVRIAFIPLGKPGDTELDDPLTELLVVALTGQRELEVLGPATTAPLRGTTRPHTDIGRQLAVEFVLSGEYRPVERLLFLQLVRVRDGRHVLAKGYRGDIDTVERHLGEAARSIAATASRDR